MKKLLPILLLFIMTNYASALSNKCSMYIPIDMMDGIIIFVPHRKSIANDLDCDGILDKDDDDIDGDGVLNSHDAFPRDNTESKDSDGDGVGDNADRPIAKAQSITLDVNESDASKEILLTGEDNDVTTLDYAIVTGPRHGSLSGIPPNVVYQVNDGYVGTDSFTFKVNDGSLDSETVTVNIVLHDKIAPIITLNGYSPMFIVQGSPYIELNATALDNVDGAVSITITQSKTNPLDTNKIGKYNITYTARDKARNVSRVFRTVNIIKAQDTTPPVITLKGAKTVSISLHEKYRDRLGATAVDNVDGTFAAKLSLRTGEYALNIHKLGTYKVKYVAADNAGNRAIPVYRTVIVRKDNIKPVITLTGEDNITIAVGSTYRDAGATATDNIDGSITSRIKVANFVKTTAPRIYTVTYDVNDSSGNKAVRVRRIVHVTDQNGPVITLKGAKTVSISLHEKYRDRLGATAVDNVDGTFAAKLSLRTGEYALNIHKLGTYKVKYVAVDKAGNRATPVYRTVIVRKDNIKPVIRLKGNKNITIVVGSIYHDAGATAIDNIDGGITSLIQVVNPVKTTAPRTYTVTYDVNDSSGNKARRVRRTVRVIRAQDTTPPIIKINGVASITVAHGSTYHDAGATARDTVDGNVEVRVENNVNTNKVGQYKVRYFATDSSGNSASKDRIINVTDQTKPQIALVGDETVSIEKGTDFTDLGATVSDNVDSNRHITYDTSKGTVDKDKVGTYTIMYTATDRAGNKADSITRTVNVTELKPNIDNLSKQTLTVGTYVNTSSIVFENHGGAMSGCSISPELPKGLTLSFQENQQKCYIFGRPEAEISSTQYTVTAISDAGNDSATVTIEILPKAPKLQSISRDIVLTVGQEINKDRIVFENSGGTIESCRINANFPQPIGMNIGLYEGNCVIFGTPTRIQSKQKSRMIATNKGGESKANVYITVEDGPPKLVSPGSVNLTTGKSIEAIIIENIGGTINDSGCTINKSLPEGLSIDNESCRITGTPTQIQHKTAYNITARNDNNEYSTVELNITIEKLQVTVKGTVTYDSVPATPQGLDYPNTRILPVKGVVVEVIAENLTVLDSTVTNDKGEYSFKVDSGKKVKIRVLAELEDNSEDSKWHIEVIDNTKDDEIYALEGKFRSVGGNSQQIRNLYAPSGWDSGIREYTSAEARKAAPFAILSVIYEGIQKIHKIDRNLYFPDLSIGWSVKNTTESFGDNKRGWIGGAHYIASSNLILFSGKQHINTDEYDATVIAHEFAHYIVFSLSRSDSIGGIHYSGSMIDIRLAFDEGLATAISLLINDTHTSIDTMGSRQEKVFQINILNPGSPAGWYNEHSIASILYQIGHDVNIGFKNFFKVLLEDEYKKSESFLSIFTYITYFKNMMPIHNDSIDLLCQGSNIEPISDIFGTGRVNRKNENANPLYSELTLDKNATLIANYSATSVSFKSQLGRRMFAYFDVHNAGKYVVKLCGSSGTAARIGVFHKGRLLEPNYIGTNGRLGECKRITPYENKYDDGLSSGRYIIEIMDKSTETDKTKLISGAEFNLSVERVAP